MKFPIFASFIVFIIWLKYELGKTNKIKQNSIQDFWEKESAANQVRKKSLEHLHYIEIPYDLLADDILPDDTTILEAARTIESLRGKKIVNLTGITNTELKMTYGTANITALSEYDENYTILITALYKMASTLYDNGYVETAIPLLEFGIMTKTDVSGYYRLLYDYYLSIDNKEKINWLRETAEALNSVMKNSITRLLWEDVRTC